MDITFTREEWDLLSNSLGLIHSNKRNLQTTLGMQDLILDPTKCEHLLYVLTPIIHSPSIKVTASLLSKRIAFLTTASCLYAMTVLNKGLNFSAENCYLDYGFDNRLWQSKMPLSDLTFICAPLCHRDDWRRNIIRQLFAENLTKLWQAFVNVTKINPRILWENTAVRVYLLYEKRMQSTQCPHLKQRITNDFNFLLDAKNFNLFDMDYNPLTRFNHAKIHVENLDTDIRFRKSCCFYYQASVPIEYCSTCPLLHPRLKNKK
jgi:ferric iron reductase protein FhuF